MKYFASSQNIDIYNIKEFKRDDSQIFCSYGILRGVAECINLSKNFIYIDNGFMSGSSRNFSKNISEKKFVSDIFNLSGYYRVIKNDLIFNKKKISNNRDRFISLNIDLKDLNKKGEFILLSEPSKYILQFNNENNWMEKTLNLIKQHTDRKIIVHNKFSTEPLLSLLKKAYAFVSYQSTASFRSISEGVPAFFTHNSLKQFGNIEDIENRKLNHELLYQAANSQWKLKEFFSQDFYNYINFLIEDK